MKQQSKKKRVVESSLSSAPDTNMEQIDASSKKNPKPDINEEAGEEENEARGNGSKKEEKEQLSSSDEDQWEAADDVPQKRANPKKVPEEAHSSSFDENSDGDYEEATLSQQEAANEVSKILESEPEEESFVAHSPPKRYRPAIKGIYLYYHHHHYL